MAIITVMTSTEDAGVSMRLVDCPHCKASGRGTGGIDEVAEMSANVTEYTGSRGQVLQK